MSERDPSRPRGRARFEHMLREQARTADELSARAPHGLAEHHEREADVLRDNVEHVRTRLTAEQHESLDRMSEGGMRALARLGRYVAGWIKR